MRFYTLLLTCQQEAASLDDLKRVCEIGLGTFQPSGQKNLYVIEKTIIDERFFWLSCSYDDASSFVDYVVSQSTGEKQPNPKNKDQVEPRKQFFACYDTHTKLLFINDLNRRPTLAAYLSDAIQRDFVIKNIYASVDEFCDRVKAIREFRYVQIDNLFGRSSDIFQQVGNMWGQDLPSKVYMKISYNDIPMHQGGRALVEKFHRRRSEFENVIIVGCDDEGVEQTFDFSSIIKRVEINPQKDENEQYDTSEVRDLLLTKLRE